MAEWLFEDLPADSLVARGPVWFRTVLFPRGFSDCEGREGSSAEWKSEKFKIKNWTKIQISTEMNLEPKDKGTRKKTF